MEKLKSILKEVKANQYGITPDHIKITADILPATLEICFSISADNIVREQWKCKAEREAVALSLYSKIQPHINHDFIQRGKKTELFWLHSETISEVLRYLAANGTSCILPEKPETIRDMKKMLMRKLDTFEVIKKLPNEKTEATYTLTKQEVKKHIESFVSKWGAFLENISVYEDVDEFFYKMVFVMFYFYNVEIYTLSKEIIIGFRDEKPIHKIIIG